MPNDDYTVVEVVDEHSEQGPITVTGARINGQPVRVAAKGIDVSYDIPQEGEDARSFVMVTVTLMVDEFHIHRPPQRVRDETKLTGVPLDFPRNHPATRELRVDEVDSSLPFGHPDQPYMAAGPEDAEHRPSLDDLTGTLDGDELWEAEKTYGIDWFHPDNGAPPVAHLTERSPMVAKLIWRAAQIDGIRRAAELVYMLRDKPRAPQTPWEHRSRLRSVANYLEGGGSWGDMIPKADDTPDAGDGEPGPL